MAQRVPGKSVEMEKHRIICSYSSDEKSCIAWLSLLGDIALDHAIISTKSCRAEGKSLARAAFIGEYCTLAVSQSAAKVSRSGVISTLRFLYLFHTS